jgi:hypothetical protein
MTLEVTPAAVTHVVYIQQGSAVGDGDSWNPKRVAAVFTLAVNHHEGAVLQGRPFSFQFVAFSGGWPEPACPLRISMIL